MTRAPILHMESYAGIFCWALVIKQTGPTMQNLAENKSNAEREELKG